MSCDHQEPKSPNVKKEKEPTSFAVTNPSRVIPAQVRFLSAQQSQTQRYRPVDLVRASRPFGIVMLVDSDPAAPEDVVTVERVALGAGEEAEAPEPFEWDPNDE